MKREKEFYETPELDVFVLETEQCFAASAEEDSFGFEEAVEEIW